ncbi:LADA_0B10660g1_1 [Lachancea dasiensis]|uniref:LADA_0B10660g1_1 n=1 Tax=Lachancea dasiensis TaxID=1072105 RepID=A0A1G4IVJ3_9SACH|nr:LADA_0B10660g1_1 [Lachancea dasiensis]
MAMTEADRELSVEEEYDLWKSNVPLMYDFVSETKLLWPSLTIQWLPNDTSDASQQQLILGTHTSGEEQNYLKIASVELPEEIAEDKAPQPSKEQESSPGQTNGQPQQVVSKIKITKKFDHDEEVTRARHAPFNSNLIATINGCGSVFLYDRSLDKEDALRAKFAYHKENGYGLNFSIPSPGSLLSCSDDGTIALWDVQAAKEVPTFVNKSHSDIVNEVKWHETDPNLYGSVSEDKTLIIHDRRTEQAIVTMKQDESFNTLAFSKNSSNLFAGAGSDSQVYLYDLRNPGVALHSMSGHQDAVTSLEFSPHRDGVLCSGSSDRRVLVWDLFQIGAEQQQEDADDGVPELLMMHAGHRSAVNDFSCNENIPWLMASVEEENIVQIWKTSKKLTNPSNPGEYDIHTLE